MERRGFLAGILAAGMAPAIVRAESLMRIVVPKGRLYIGFNHDPLIYYGPNTFEGGAEFFPELSGNELWNLIGQSCRLPIFTHWLHPENMPAHGIREIHKHPERDSDK